MGTKLRLNPSLESNMHSKGVVCLRRMCKRKVGGEGRGERGLGRTGEKEGKYPGGGKS